MFNRRYLIVLGFVIVVIIAIVTRFAYQKFAGNTNFNDLTPRQSALMQVEGLLKAAQKYPTGEVPINDGLYQYYDSVHPQCWSMIQDIMRMNANKYTLEVYKYYDSKEDPYPVHDYIEIDMRVIFPDNHIISIVYPQGGLSECNKVE